MSDPEPLPSERSDLQNGIGSLVIGLADVIRLALQQQAIRRLESHQLTAREEERLNRAFYDLAVEMRSVKEKFGLDPDEDIPLKLGDIDGHDINVADILDTLINKGVVLKADLSLDIAEVPLADASVLLRLGDPSLQGSQE